MEQAMQHFLGNLAKQHYAPVNLCTLELIELSTRREAQRVTAVHQGRQLTSQYQPILSLPHHRTVGFEALLRAFTLEGNPVSPLTVFGECKTEDENVFLDRLCRNIHVRNFQFQAPDNTWLFLNVSPDVVTRGNKYGAYFADLLRHYNIDPARVVIEILEERVTDEAVLADTVAYYRDLGCLIAIDDFGAGSSNFERIWRISPNIVKLDRSMIVQAAVQPRVRRVIPNLVSLIHESGSLSLMEGIETETEALIAMDAGIDFVQGYYFARPSPDLAAHQDGAEVGLAKLCNSFREFSQVEAERSHAQLLPYLVAFSKALSHLRSDGSLAETITMFQNLARFERCFVLDHEGRQIGNNLVSPTVSARHDPRFAPLSGTAGAVWSRRHYFRRAMSNPGEVQITRPYLSVSGLNMCITLSVMLDTKHGPQILCVDLDWTDH